MVCAMAELDEAAEIISEAERASSAGDHASAELALRRALKLQEASFGPVHPDVANTLNNLGVVCDILGRPNEAEFLYRRALGIARKTLPADHPYIATSLQNLSNLYRAQGKPEKLAQVADGRSQRSGLPGIDLPDEAVVEGERPADIIPGQADASADSRSQTLYERLAHQPVLLVAAGVVLLVVAWLLVGDRDGPDAPVQDEAAAGTPLHAPVVERDVLVAPDVIPVTGAADAPVDIPVADTVEDASPEPAPDRPDPSAVPSVAAAGVVADARVCSRLVTRDTDGAPLTDWECRTVVDSVAPGRLFFYTRVRSRTDATIEHRWYRDERLAHEIGLQIEANDGPGYRTYSFRTVSPQERGSWRVELRSADEEVLHAEDFMVR